MNADASHELVAVSRLYGGDPAFVLAGGGNTSYKMSDRLFVKASGHALATIDASGFVELDRSVLADLLDARLPDEPREREAEFVRRVMHARVRPDLGQRPSVEALIHHLLPDTFVVHTHPTRVNGLTCCVEGERIARDLFGDTTAWQPYVDPGVTLARALRDTLARRDMPADAVLLENHGLIVGGADAAEVAAATHRVMDPLGVPQVAPSAGDPGLVAAVVDAVRVRHPDLHVATDASPEVVAVASSDALRPVVLGGALTPDHIVYCRSVPLWIDGPDVFSPAFHAYTNAFGFEPWVAMVAGAGVVAFRDREVSVRQSLALGQDACAILLDAHARGGVRLMSDAHRRFIEEWEVEAYRRQVSASA